MIFFQVLAKNVSSWARQEKTKKIPGQLMTLVQFFSAVGGAVGPDIKDVDLQPEGEPE